MATVTPLTSIPGLDSSTSHRSGQGTSQTGLIQGELLKATVLENLSGNRILLDFYGTRFITDSKTPLTVGKQLQFQAFYPQAQSQQSQESLPRSPAWLPKATVMEALADNRYVLDFNGTRVIAEFKTPLTIGQSIQLQIVSSSQNESAPAQQGSPFVIGQMLNATVTDVLPNNNYLFDIHGSKIEVHSPAVLSPGQQLNLQITGTSPQVQLTIVSDFFSTLAGKPLVLLANTLDIGLSFHDYSTGPRNRTDTTIPSIPKHASIPCSQRFKFSVEK